MFYMNQSCNKNVPLSPLEVLSGSYKPFIYPWAVEITQKHDNFFWTESEISVVEDIQIWKEEKRFIVHVLRLFTQSDVSVADNYHEKLIPKIKNNEVRNMLSCFAAREVIHQRAYALLNDSLGLPDSDYSIFKAIPEMYKKILFITDSDISTSEGFALALVKNIIGEGICLFGSFVMLLSFQKNGKLMGMGKVVEWSIRDELIHVDGIIRIYNQWIKEHPELQNEKLKTKVQELFKKGLEIEEEFIDLSFENNKGIKDITSPDLKKYLKKLVDKRLEEINIEPIYNIKENPIEWADWIIYGLDHSNFIESIVTDYEIGSTKGSWKDVYKDYFDKKK